MYTVFACNTRHKTVVCYRECPYQRSRRKKVRRDSLVPFSTPGPQIYMPAPTKITRAER